MAKTLCTKCKERETPSDRDPLCNTCLEEYREVLDDMGVNDTGVPPDAGDDWYA